MNTGEASNPYRLIIQGEDTGSANTIEIDTSGLTGGGTVPSFTEQTAAADAELSINGIDVVSDSNTVSDSITGLTLELTGTTSEPGMPDAVLRGYLEGSSISFIKRYVERGQNVPDKILYQGAISDDANVISGQWSISPGIVPTW